MDIKIFSAYENRPVPKYEKISSKSSVDSLGYRTTKEQVESFILAGARLDAFRAGFYDSDLIDPKISQEIHDQILEDMDANPTSKPLTYLEAYEMQLKVNQRLKEQSSESIANLKALRNKAPSVVAPVAPPPPPPPASAPAAEK